MVRFDVYQDWHRPGPLDCRNRGDSRVRNRDHLAPGPYVIRGKSEVQGIGAASHTYGVGHTHVGCKLLLEFSDLFPKYVDPPLQHALNGLIDLALVSKVLGTRVGAQNHPDTCTLGT